MDGDRQRPAKTATSMRRQSPVSAQGVVWAVVVVALLYIAFLMLSSLGIVTDHDREADGWMYRDVSMIPKACPPLAKDVEMIASGRIMTVRQAKDIADRLRATARASSQATERYEGRLRMGMPAGRPPLACTTSDPSYEYGEIPMLEEYRFRISDRENR